MTALRADDKTRTKASEFVAAVGTRVRREGWRDDSAKGQGAKKAEHYRMHEDEDDRCKKARITWKAGQEQRVEKGERAIEGRTIREEREDIAEQQP